MYRAILAAASAVVLAAGVAACKVTVPPSVSSSPAPPSSPATPSPPPAPGGSGLSVLTEPASGLGQIYQLITGAKSSIDLTMYELNDQTAESDLAAAAGRGVDVKVILDQHLEKSRNTAAYDYLSGHGAHVAWAPAGTTYHQKTLTVDNATSVIMTLNMVSSDYPDTRDFAVIDTSGTDVSAIVGTFNSDFTGQPITPPDGADLVWSPTNSQASILSVINGAQHTLALENEEMDDDAVTSALEAAAKRGVDVTVTMTADSEWDRAFAELAAAGVHIRLYPDDSGVLYIHAKAIVADGGQADQRVLVGSENFSDASLQENRELGIVTTSPAVISAIAPVLASDYDSATPYHS
jgi:cardiolipin synthase A/B